MSETDDETLEEDSQRLTFTDALTFETTKDDLWAVVSDPETLTSCIPGAESVERLSERAYTCEITRGISHLTVSLSGEAEFVELQAPDHVVVSGSAFDSKTGSTVDVLAAMEMTSRDDGDVELAYQAEVEFSGGVASMGTSVVRPIVSRDVDTYFENVRAVVEDELDRSG